jgi:TolB-like protein/tRNA A-37 threonylcarbamoyl transferase component Bud32/Tfp pilus assembly protein PilF
MGVKCPKCQYENPDDTLFCGKCGTQFPSPEKAEITVTLETPKEELTTGSTFAERYQIIEELGKGGMGRVYKAHDTKIKEKIALKLIKPEIAKDKKTIERFRNELRLARKIRHKNVCGMFDLGEEKGTHYITMEFVPGEDLRSSIRRFGQLPIGKSISIAKQICEGLSEAHRLGVVHRDLKSNNIMIDKEGNARIMDFGIARSVEARRITGEGMMIGTPEYMSPEQVESKEVDQRSDIYSLGILLYEMLTGQVPFQGDTSFSIGVKHKSERPKDPRRLNDQIPETLSRIILKCLEKENYRRFQNAEEILDAFDKMGEPRTDTVRISDWKTSIAVLPFKNMSADPEQEYFCEGLAEELINALTQIKDMRVVARTSAFSFKGKELDIREIGKKLNVETVLEGSVRKAENRLRVTAQLINVEDGYHLWSERFDKELADIFAIQDEIAHAVSTKMKMQLQSKGEEGVPKRYTENVEAYNLYLKGIYWRRMLTVDRVSKSIDYFNRAIEKDPGYALAYAGLAYAYQIMYFYSPAPSKDLYPKALKAAKKALELDDGLAEAHEALGVIKSYWEWDWEGAERELRRTLELDPGYIWAHFHLASIHIYHGRFVEALEGLQKIHDLDPLNAAFIRNIGQCYLRAGMLREAEEAIRNTIEIDPFIPPTWIFLGYILLKQSRYEEALEAMRKDSVKESVLELNIGIVYARMGKREEALRILTDWLERSKKEFAAPYYMALLCFAIGKNDLGFQWLEKGYEEHDAWLMSLKVDFLLDDVRDDPRFKVLLNKMNLE